MRGRIAGGVLSDEKVRGDAMSDRLEDELRALGLAAPAQGYDQLEGRIWRSIEAARETRRSAPLLLGVRAAAVGGALGLGVMGGGATAVALAGEVPEVSAFSVRTGLAPSTLLDDHG